MRIINIAMMVIIILTASGCQSRPDKTIIEGEAVKLIDFGIDEDAGVTSQLVPGFIDIADTGWTIYRGLLLPKTEYISSDGTRSIIKDDSILENRRIYRFYVRPRPWATVPENARRTFHWVTGITDIIRLAPPPDSTRYLDIYKIQQLSDTPLYRMPQPVYQIDIDTP